MGCTVVLLRDSYGKPSATRLIGRDLTERKREEEHLREASRARTSRSRRSGTSPIRCRRSSGRPGPDGRVDYYNRRWYELLGVAASGRLPMPSGGSRRSIRTTAGRRTIVDGVGAQRHAVRDGYRLEFRARPTAFAGIWAARCRCSDEAGAIVRWYGTSTDIHDRKMAESELAESRARLRAALDASVTGTFRWDIVTNVLDSDENLDRLFGLAPGATARSLADFFRLVHADDRERVVDACRRCADQGADFEEEFRVVWPDGTVRWLFDKGKTMLGSDGRPRCMAGACVDVTERREKEEALLRRGSAEGRVPRDARARAAQPAGADHLLGRALERQMPAPEARRPLEIIARQAKRMTRIVDDLLDVSRVTQGKISLQARAPRPRERRRQRRRSEPRRYGRARPSPRRAASPSTPLPVSGDAVRLGQVFENLLSNAANTRRRAAIVTVTVEREARTRSCRVRDTGVGISADVLPRIFDLFAQADTSLDRSEGGLGIGLTLVDRLTRMHGGTVEARATAPGSARSSWSGCRSRLTASGRRHEDRGRRGSRGAGAI